MTFSLHKVRENWHFLHHPPKPMPLRNIKMAPNLKRLWLKDEKAKASSEKTPQNTGLIKRGIVSQKMLFLNHWFYLFLIVFWPKRLIQKVRPTLKAYWLFFLYVSRAGTCEWKHLFFFCQITCTNMTGRAFLSCQFLQDIWTNFPVVL